VSVAAASAPPAALSLPRVELRIPRLRAVFRFTYAFHAREMRFERDAGGGFERLFAETFSFHASRHDPAELYLQLEDLWANSRLLHPSVARRESEDLVRRFLGALPGCLEEALERLQGGDGEPSSLWSRVCEDVSLTAHIAQRFLVDKRLDDHPQVRVAALHLRKLLFRSTLGVVATRVRPESLERYMRGDAELDASSEFGAYYALAGDDPDAVDRTVLAVAERVFHRWLEDVCLDESEEMFDSAGSPFEDRATEVLAAVAADGRGPVSRARELTPFLRRPRDRDCQRVLSKLETFFLRQYDIHHGAVVIHQARRLQQGTDEPDRNLSWHNRRTYLLALVLPLLPFLAAIFAYDGPARPVIDLMASAEVVAVIAVATWFLVYRFMWRKDLTFFHAAVPRIAAGIIVGYLPVFLIDEVWDLAEQSWTTLATVVVMLGMPTLLYIYVEVQRRLGDPQEAFRRALDIVLLGLLQSAAFGLVVTSLLGGLMSTRNWGQEEWREGVGEVTLPALQEHLAPFLGQLPRMVGCEPFMAFPTAVLLMTFMAFFIGTFLQLLWEELPITEPL
jgi:hypothetical protein